MSRQRRVSLQPFTCSLLNRKGGVGKSTLSHNLGGVFSEMGFRTLLVDADPQASLSQGLMIGGVKAALALGKRDSLAGLFDPRLDLTPADIIRPTRWERLDLAPASAELNTYNLPNPIETSPDWQAALGHFLQEVRAKYDVILIDCPPNLNLCSYGALLGSNFVLTPLQPESYGGQGIAHVLQFVELAKRSGNKDLRLLGFVLSMVGRRLSIQKLYQEEIRKLYGKDVFDADVPFLTAFKEAVSSGTPVNFYKPASEATRAIRAVAEEILARVEEYQQTTMEVS